MSDNNTNPVQKLVIGGEPLKKSVLTEATKTTEVVESMDESQEVVSSSMEKMESKTEMMEMIEKDDTSEKIIINQEKSAVSKPQMSNNNLIKDEETIKMLKSLNFWAKFQIILGCVSVGFLILIGTVYAFTIILIPVTLFYWALAGLTIWLLITLYKSISKFNELAEVKTQDDFNIKTLEGLNLMKTYYKINGIFTMVSLGLLALVIVGGIILLIVFGSNPAFQKGFSEGLQSTGNPSLISTKDTEFLGN